MERSPGHTSVRPWYQPLTTHVEELRVIGLAYPGLPQILRILLPHPALLLVAVPDFQVLFRCSGSSGRHPSRCWPGDLARRAMFPRHSYRPRFSFARHALLHVVPALESDLRPCAPIPENGL